MRQDPAPNTHPTCPNHRTCERLRKLGYAGEGCPTVNDLLRTCEQAGVDWREVLALGE